MYQEITQRGDCTTVKDLDITGNDLMEYGITGKQIGTTLNNLLEIVIENPKLNDKATLIAMIEK
jgi:tRNA nucleotidyltransferase (CCA-adding enzyme)